MTGFLPDGSWADPLTRKERRVVAELLARASQKFWEGAAARPLRARAHDMDAREDLFGELVGASKEMSDLHLDVTERARVAAS